MGRRKIENSRNITIGVRITDDEKRRLDKCCEKTGMSISDVLRIGVDKVFKNKKED